MKIIDLLFGIVPRDHPTADEVKGLVANHLADLTPPQQAAVELYAWAHRDGWGHVAVHADLEKIR